MKPDTRHERKKSSKETNRSSTYLNEKILFNPRFFVLIILGLILLIIPLMILIGFIYSYDVKTGPLVIFIVLLVMGLDVILMAWFFPMIKLKKDLFKIISLKRYGSTGSEKNVFYWSDVIKISITEYNRLMIMTIKEEVTGPIINHSMFEELQRYHKGSIEGMCKEHRDLQPACIELKNDFRMILRIGIIYSVMPVLITLLILWWLESFPQSVVCLTISFIPSIFILKFFFFDNLHIIGESPKKILIFKDRIEFIYPKKQTTFRYSDISSLSGVLIKRRFKIPWNVIYLTINMKSKEEVKIGPLIYRHLPKIFDSAQNWTNIYCCVDVGLAEIYKRQNIPLPNHKKVVPATKSCKPCKKIKPIRRSAIFRKITNTYYQKLMKITAIIISILALFFIIILILSIPNPILIGFTLFFSLLFFGFFAFDNLRVLYKMPRVIKINRNEIRLEHPQISEPFEVLPTADIKQVSLYTQSRTKRFPLSFLYLRIETIKGFVYDVGPLEKKDVLVCVEVINDIIA